MLHWRKTQTCECTFSPQTFWLATGVTNNMSLFVSRVPSKPWQWTSTHMAKALKVKQLNGIQLSFILLFAPVTWQNILSYQKIIRNLVIIWILSVVCCWHFPSVRIHHSPFKESFMLIKVILNSYWSQVCMAHLSLFCGVLVQPSGQQLNCSLSLHHNVTPFRLGEVRIKKTYERRWYPNMLK